MNDAKILQNMSLEELWQLFPINLAPYDPEWAKWAEEEIEHLRTILKPTNPIINHIGSTSIAGISAKPIVDILVEIADSVDWESIGIIMETAGYIMMSRSEERMSFNKGYTIHGYADKVYHIHFHPAGSRDEILFRDYLIDHPSAAHEYERLKESLILQYRNDRDGYTTAKSAFVKDIVSKAKAKSPIGSEQQKIAERLSGKIGLTELKKIAAWGGESDCNKDFLWRMSHSDDRKRSVNSLWAMTHFGPEDSGWLAAIKPRVILRLLSEKDTSKKRIFLQLLKQQDFDPDSPLTVRLLDYCFPKINAECEPYAVRCFSLYVAYQICRHYPELITELKEYLQMLSLQTLSPGLKSAHRQITHKLTRHPGRLDRKS